eukprot:1097061-Pelagomonas_calceolata.AAC.2
MRLNPWHDKLHDEWHGKFHDEFHLKLMMIRCPGCPWLPPKHWQAFPDCYSLIHRPPQNASA